MKKITIKFFDIEIEKEKFHHTYFNKKMFIK